MPAPRRVAPEPELDAEVAAPAETASEVAPTSSARYVGDYKLKTSIEEPPASWKPTSATREPARAPELGGLDRLPLSERLKRTQVPALVVEDEESLRAVMSAVQAMTGVPIVVHPAAEHAALDEGVVFSLNLTNPISVENVLKIVTNMAGDEVTWTLRHDVVMVTTREKARGAGRLVSYDIKHLTFGRTDFTAPRIDRLRLLDELEDDDGGGPFGGVGETIVEMTEDDVLELVQSNVAPTTWDDDGVSIEAANGMLIVIHEPAVHREVARFLEQLGG